jgi:DNA-binding NarL/FixJ family response regulator
MKSKLSPRQLEVLELAGNGMSVKETSAKLGITESTVESHRAKILERLNAHNMAHAVHIIDIMNQIP